MSSVKNSQKELKQIIVTNESEEERMLRDMNRPDMEKFRLFMQMLRTNNALKNVKINHK